MDIIFLVLIIVAAFVLIVAYRFVLNLKPAIPVHIPGESDTLYIDDTVNHYFLCAEASDLSAIYELGRHAFGEDISPLALMELWHEKDKEVFQVLVEETTSLQEKSTRREIVAYFSIMRISRTALSRLKKNIWTGGQITPEHINSKSKIFYIGAVYGNRKYTSGLIMHNLISHLSRNIKENKISVICARPVNPKGLEQATKFNLQKGPGADRLYYRYIDRTEKG
ncbi:hypothetical protein [Fibrella forsythiae]|uniref:N-acetyltransferase domain-containing protein n=1 Tax=Fibrella forsythiae TaxID=2817061 RepID=A0ABS3JKR4_9BACT|nr:hypothetical protein [Fibrella forsythiae]MBO0950606.1 hypothetical protein [Fibrella forsythiae]